jgi:hypothetical protein
MKKTIVLCILLAAGASATPVGPCARLPLPDYDVGLVEYKLLDTVFVGDTYEFKQVAVANYSVGPALPWFEIRLPSGYTDRRPLVLGVGETTTVSWLFTQPRTYESVGIYPVCCCTLEWSLDEDPTNDGGWKYVVVLPRPGIGTAEVAVAMPYRPTASLSTRLSRKGDPDAVWYTTTGSRVRQAAARPGVYFCVQGWTARRVVLVR